MKAVQVVRVWPGGDVNVKEVLFLCSDGVGGRGRIKVGDRYIFLNGDNELLDQGSGTVIVMRHANPLMELGAGFIDGDGKFYPTPYLDADTIKQMQADTVFQFDKDPRFKRIDSLFDVLK